MYLYPLFKTLKQGSLTAGLLSNYKAVRLGHFESQDCQAHNLQGHNITHHQH